MSDTVEGEGKYYLSPIIGRIGGKTKLRETITPLIPEDIGIYIEPFIGGGSIFFSKERYAPVEVINDKDKDIIDVYRDIQKVSLNQFKSFDFTPNREKFDRLRDSTIESNPVKRLYRNLYLNKFSFSGNRMFYAPSFEERNPESIGSRIINNYKKYQERLKDVVILNEDYTKVVRKYNKPNAFFYLDPPYSAARPSWSYKFNLAPEGILKTLDTIKGKFLMSYDDSKTNRELFSKYNVYTTKTKYQLSNTETKHSAKTELLISNYHLKGKNIKAIKKSSRALKGAGLTGGRLEPLPNLTLQQFYDMYMGGKALPRTDPLFAGEDGDKKYKDYMDRIMYNYERRKQGWSPINPSAKEMDERNKRIEESEKARRDYEQSPEGWYEMNVAPFGNDDEIAPCNFNPDGSIPLDQWSGMPTTTDMSRLNCFYAEFYNPKTGKLDKETHFKRRQALNEAYNRDVGFWEQFGRGFVGSLKTFTQPILSAVSYVPGLGTIADLASTAIDFIPSPKNEIAGEGKPSEKMFYKTADFAYEKQPPKEVGDFVLFKNTPTLDAWINYKDNTIMIAVRGTSDFRDMKANSSLPFNNLINTQRYKEDKATIQQIIKQFPPSAYEYYLSGHSLGGAIVAQLKKDFPLLKDAVVYNSAYQTSDVIREDPTIKKLYTTDDPLYKLAGRTFKNKVVVPIDQKFLRGITGVLGTVARGYSGHKLTKFKSLYGEGIIA